MKQKFFVVLIAAVLAGCESKNDGIEIIPDYDAVYFTEQNVDSPAKPIQGEDSQKELENLFKEFYDEKSGQAELFKIAFHIYVNENGEIDKLKFLDETSFPFGTTEEDGILFGENQKLYPRIKEILSKMRFESARKENANVKFRFDVAYAYSIRPDGTTKAFIPFNLSLDFSNLFRNEYFITVDKQPEPIGGLVAIQKKIIYPEIAKRAGIQGRVFIKAFIDENGNVVKIEILKSAHEVLDSAASNAVLKTKFTPGEHKGKKVKTIVTVPIQFSVR